ncbi:MAG: hypothetical protein ABIQ31_20735 [Ferruginibacter sp.]
MTKYYIIVSLLIILHSCSNNDNQPVANTDVEIVEKKTDSFFPVTSFIKGQIITLDSLPVTPLQITVIKNKVDSAWIPKENLKPLLLPFLTPVISESNFTKYFKEISFNDQTLNTITFTYDPIGVIPDSITLRHWDVYVNPETERVVKVYLVKSIKDNGQVYTQQLTWQTNKSAKISTILNKPDGNMELLKEVFFIWDFTPSPKKE